MRILAAILMVLVPVAVQASEIDFSVSLLGPDGQSYKDCAAFDETKTPPVCSRIIDLSLGHFAASALNGRTPNMTVQQLVEKGQLAIRLYKGGKQTVSADDVKLIKDALPATTFPPMEILAAIQLLDPDSLTKPATK